MIVTFTSPELWVFLASSAFVLGYLIINQVGLRLTMMAGSGCYIIYYSIAGDTPLWGAIYGSILMICTNVIGLSALYLRNAHISVPRSSEDIFPLFYPVRPGDFRALMRLGSRKILNEERIITREGQPLEKLFFIIRGTAQVVKRRNAFPVPGPVFAGEVAYLLEARSSATMILPAGSEIIEWDVSKLRRAIRRKPRLKLALDAVISRDLANKVSLSVAPEDMGTVTLGKAPAVPSPAHYQETA
ncbi:MAG: cyclic nucleotide-binding domain-containing protein [Pseudomonadota bacterium]